MNQIEPIKELPKFNWLEHSKREIALTGVDLLFQTTFMWKVGNVAVVGFIYSNLLAPPWMWFALAKGITIGDLVDFRRLTKLIPSGTLTGIQADYKLGIRFAKIYEFEDTEHLREYAGIDYKLFRKK